jgi:CheY-like chemotaxis protein
MPLPLEQKPRILVADDDPSIRQLVCTIVKRENIEFDTAADGVEAIERLKRRPYSLILLDLMMPRVDGYGVVRYLAAHPPAVKPIVLLLSARSDEQCADADPDVVTGVLRKPFDMAELAVVLRHCLTCADPIPARLFYSKERALLEIAHPGTEVA